MFCPSSKQQGVFLLTGEYYLLQMQDAWLKLAIDDTRMENALLAYM